MRGFLWEENGERRQIRFSIVYFRATGQRNCFERIEITKVLNDND
jgi:hypothetical protein